MKKGDIVLVRFPFTDFSSEKLRPALVLIQENKEGDVLLAFITTQMHKREQYDILIERGEKTRIKSDSIVKLRKLLTVNKKIILGKIGELPGDKIEEVNKNLKELLQI